MALGSPMVYTDGEFGEICVRRNARARRIIFRARDGRLECTVPYSCDRTRFQSALDQLRPRLRDMFGRAEVRHAEARFTPNTRIDTGDFHFWMEEADVSRITVREDYGQIVCRYPRHQQWDNESVQRWLTEVVEESLRRHAKVTFPPRLYALAQTRGLRFNRVSIHKTKGRWGSCSSRGNINLSLYLMLVPRHLQDYVMHHELTHLVEMNHSPRFWALLDEATGGHAQQYREEMRNFNTEVLG